MARPGSSSTAGTAPQLPARQGGVPGRAVGPEAELRPLRVAMLLANSGAADARVTKEAESLTAAGHDVTVYCLASAGLPADERRNHVRWVRCAEPHRAWWGAAGAAAQPVASAVAATRAAPPPRRHAPRLGVWVPALAGMTDAKPVFDDIRDTAAIARAGLIGAISAVAHHAKATVAPFIAHELHAKTFVARVAADAPDVVHAHDYEVLPAAVRIAQRVHAITGARPPVVYDMHEYEAGRWPVAGRWLSAWKAHVEARAVRAVDAAITVSPSIGEAFAKLYRRPLPHLILNAPVDAPPDAPRTRPGLRAELGLDADTPLAVHVGTTGEGRGIGTLLEALTRLPRLHLALVGTVRPELAGVIAQAECDPRIAGRLHLVPPVPHAEVVPFIASADVGVAAIQPLCLSYEYCLPNKLFEMTLAGLPLVVSDTRDMARFVTETGNGVVADTGDPVALAAALTRVLADSAKLRPDAARLAELRASLGWSTQAARLAELYTTLGVHRQFVAARRLAKRRRVLMVNLIDWRTMCGGAQHQLGLFGGWTAAGHDVRMLSPSRTADAQPAGVPKTRLTQIASVAKFRLPAALDTLVQAAVLPWLIRWHKPDLVYSRHNTFTPALVLVCRLMRTPVVIEHNAWLPSQRRVDDGSSWLGQLEGVGQDLASRWADGARTVTPGIARHLGQLGVPHHQMVAVGNGTDTRRFRPLERSAALAQFGLDPARKTVGFIGNVMPWHGLNQALTGFGLAAKRFPELDLVVFGDGPGVPGLKAEAERLGLSSRVHWMGRVPLASANLAINCLDIALLPLSARHDIGFGFSAIKLRDYAAAGRIVLTGRLPGAIELEDEPWLFTHAPDDGADLGAKLITVLARDESHAAARTEARRYAEAHFDWSVICDRIDAFVAARLSARQAHR